jgi:tetratricopeptide (TPR) repeat protein
MTITDLLKVTSSPSVSTDERLDAALSAYQQAQNSGRMAEVLSALMCVRDSAGDMTPTQRIELEIAIASIEGEIGLADAARARLEACKEEASRTDALQSCRVGYYLAVLCVRAGLIDEAERARDFFAQQLIPDTPKRMRLRFDHISAIIEEHRKNWDEAGQSYRRCLRLAGPDEAGVAMASRNGLARVLIAQSSFAEAVMVLESVDEPASGEYQAVHEVGHLAYAYLGAGAFDNARRLSEEGIERAVELDISELAAQLYIARALCDWHDFDIEAARAAVRKSASIDLSPLNRELCLVLDAWLSEKPLPSPSHAPTASVVRLLQGDHSSETPNGPTEAVFAAVLAERRHRFVISADAMNLSVDRKHHDLSQRPALRKILVRLLEARERDHGPVATGDLFEAGWPDVKQVGPNGLRRVYTEIHRLRKLGLEIESIDGGYRLVTAIQVQT